MLNYQRPLSPNSRLASMGVVGWWLSLPGQVGGLRWPALIGNSPINWTIPSGSFGSGWETWGAWPPRIGRNSSFNVGGSDSTWGRIQNTATMNFATGFTAAAWVWRVGSMPDGQVLCQFTNAGGNYNGWGLGLSGSVTYITINGANRLQNNLPLGWTYLMTTWDGSHVYIYENGVQVNSAAWSTAPTSTTHDFIVGAYYTNGNDTGGTPQVRTSANFDDILIGTRAFTAAEAYWAYQQSIAGWPGELDTRTADVGRIMVALAPPPGTPPGPTIATVEAPAPHPGGVILGAAKLPFTPASLQAPRPVVARAEPPQPHPGAALVAAPGSQWPYTPPPPPTPPPGTIARAEPPQPFPGAVWTTRNQPFTPMPPGPPPPACIARAEVPRPHPGQAIAAHNPGLAPPPVCPLPPATIARAEPPPAHPGAALVAAPPSQWPFTPPPPPVPPPPCIAVAEPPQPYPGRALWCIGGVAYPPQPIINTSFNLRSRFLVVRDDSGAELYRR